ncbi:hypothetical protein Clacol_009253 [Clathrus columnatus]|uniref:Uncharacterized protein n=1 Tax=Clathrus columnatus TaxID=1419009 RepID=A0AAV5AQL4_9AGAM|nr:hypothetical protein Clacol_009253 [Clathrus columnatus]
MNTFSEPYTRDDELGSLDDIRDAIHRLEESHKTKGVPLSGRIIHVVHFLPIISTLTSKRGSALPSPPTTPEPPASPLANSPLSTPVSLEPLWSLTPRSGHHALISGIRALSETHEQVLVGWTGDIQVGKDSQTVPIESLLDEDKKSLEEALAGYKHTDSDEDYTTPPLPSPEHEKPLTYKPVWLSNKTAHKHYEGYSKKTLWPLFHYLLWQDVASEIPSDDFEWQAYVDVNKEFGQTVKSIYRPGDLVWVHDYHLLLFPKIFRQLVPEAHVGRKEILDGMLGANLVCFQTYSYSRHFASSCVRVCGYESHSKGIEVEGHITSIMHCPVGIDAARVARDTLIAGVQPKVRALQNLYQGKKIIVGRDKLDVIRGVIQKLRAFEKLLTDYPQWRGKVVLIQVTSPSPSDSSKLERQISELTIKKDEFYALLSAADLGLITPLRDGMNTTSMEFVIAQERTYQSPLVISEFMGISGHMKEALQVNPWNLDDVAAAINRGLLMSSTEKQRRHESLYKVVTTHTSRHWAAVLVKFLLSQISQENAAQTPYLDATRLSSAYHNAKKRLILLDYDGTLAPIVKVPSAAVPSTETLEALSRLTEDSQNLVYIISGRDSEFLVQHLGHITKLGMSAEHGCFVKEPASSEWSNLTTQLDMSWMNEVREIFEYYTERTTGSFIELKKSSITWHYRASDPEWGVFQCRQCLDLLENNLVHKRPIEGTLKYLFLRASLTYYSTVLVGKKNLEVRPIAVNKGEIVKRLLYNHPDTEFVFCAGDDKTDEDMFRSLRLPPVLNKDALVMQPPVSAAIFEPSNVLKPVELKIHPDAIFSTTVGPSNKKTRALWHVNSPAEIVESLLSLTKDEAKL